MIRSTEEYGHQLCMLPNYWIYMCLPRCDVVLHDMQNKASIIDSNFCLMHMHSIGHTTARYGWQCSTHAPRRDGTRVP